MNSIPGSKIENVSTGDNSLAFFPVFENGLDLVD